MTPLEASAREEIAALMQEIETQPNHAGHVSRLALQLFDQLVDLHGLGPHERLLLEAAGCLHDIGHVNDYLGASHHKESARLIREHPWKSFSPLDVEIIALAARYHRKSTPESKHPEFAALSRYDRQIVKVLAALLRLADSLDRNHEQFVTNIKIELGQNRIVLRLETNGPALREVLSAYGKCDFVESVFQRELVFMIGEEIIQRPPPPTEPETPMPEDLS